MIGLPQKQSIYSLYLLQMGLFIIKDSDDFNASEVAFAIEPDEKRIVKSIYISKLLITYPHDKKPTKIITNINFLFSFSQIVKNNLQKMSDLDRETLLQDTNSSLELEYETKISLNNLFLLIINNFENPEMRKEITQSMYHIEYNSFLTIKLSLDLAIVPIRK